MLLDRGADINVVGGRYGTGHCPGLCHMEKQCGIDINATRARGRYQCRRWHVWPVVLAECEGNRNIVQYLDSWDGGLSEGEGPSPASELPIGYLESES